MDLAQTVWRSFGDCCVFCENGDTAQVHVLSGIRGMWKGQGSWGNLQQAAKVCGAGPTQGVTGWATAMVQVTGGHTPEHNQNEKETCDLNNNTHDTTSNMCP
eukprot:CAMPEP_0174348626 /NCGR_PEP_ID=MMETSP0811_2-20130205/5180_1 /TAXON_ID=73025 ORGANISM="Eutreptiella gymnastica-like, Strain CCMP1594" /NCGR_SAMPLE_ID=MMETSP0811_2 /ASSEMBLY_ACC=CAM_ASM_000667 /LENGTH=101 /DNA_ID=CAMNT_0015475365 /DNA_START=663 /DNA_END=968 /DNA_ORIENTATION=-